MSDQNSGPDGDGDGGVVRVVGLNGSPTQPSRSRVLLQAALDGLPAGQLIDLASLDAGALLAIGSDPDVDAARDAVLAAQIVVVATPVYRATYTALTKTIFDLLPQGALKGTVVIPIATGYGPDHSLAIDHGLRPLVASLEGWTTPTGVYATNADIDDGVIAPKIEAKIDAATAEALALARAVGNLDNSGR